MLRTPRKTQEPKLDSEVVGKNSTPVATNAAANPTPNKWHSSLRSARKATAAVLQKGRGQNQNQNHNQDKEKAPEVVATATTTPQPSGSLISSTSLMKGVQGQAEPPIDYSDSFSFKPMSLTVPADFVPISSCDDIDPPTFEDKSSSMSSNFSKLLNNAMKVDQVRYNVKKASLESSLQSVMDPDKSVEDLQQEMETSYAELQKKQSEASSQSTSTSDPGIDEKEKDNNYIKQDTLSVEEAQKRLIDQLKQGLNYIAKENKQLKAAKSTMEKDLMKEKAAYVEKLSKKHKEVEERNLKLAVLEAHFCQLNNSAINEQLNSEDEPSEMGRSDQVVEDGSSDDAKGNPDEKSDEAATETLSTVDGGKLDEKMTEKKGPSPVKQTSVSSIIQIDKGYYNDLEDTVKRETALRKQVEEFNRDMVTKYNELVKDSGNEINELKDQALRQERTISTLEQNLQQMRQAKFKQKKGKVKHSKGHRRRATVSAVPSDDELLVGLDDHDEYSMSANSSTLNSYHENEHEHKEEVNEKNEDVKKEATVDVEEAVASAVSEALKKKEEEHSSNMEVFSKQLELKDKIISRLESKMYGLVKNKHEAVATSPQRPNRAIPKDVMMRNIAVTNELMDSSIRRLESMLSRLERTEGTDDIAPIRRMALKVSSVHEEMKIAMKLIELRVENQVESIRQKGGKGHDSAVSNEDKKGGQTSGETVESSVSSQESIEDLITKVQTEAMKALKETESSVKKEIDGVKDQLENFEFDLAEKADTIEALELACAEHDKKFRSLQEQYEGLQF